LDLEGLLESRSTRAIYRKLEGYSLPKGQARVRKDKDTVDKEICDDMVLVFMEIADYVIIISSTKSKDSTGDQNIC
jgi:hypothetical protein